MELDKTLLLDSWKEIEAIEQETKLLLETVRGKSKTQKTQEKANEAQKKKDTKAQNSQSKTTTKKKSSTSEKIPKLGLQPATRATVEILDDASPDVTPREEEEQETKPTHDNEKNFRNLDFSYEQSRIRKGVDKYVTAKYNSADEIEQEKQRLMNIEERARERARFLQKESKNRSEYLQSDRAAVAIQRTFRGHLGRKKFSLTYQIKRVLVTDDPNDWIEVHDKETGDMWYYNKVTQESQWTKPDILLQPKLSSGLPTLSKSKKSLPDSNKNKRQRAIEVSMSLPSLDAMKATAVPTVSGDTPNRKKSKYITPDQQKRMMSKSINDLKEQLHTQKEIDNELGISKLNKIEALTAPDGAFKPQLRNVVMDALLDTRFDNVATVLADTRWFEKNEEVVPNKDTKREMEKLGLIESKIDPFRPPLVSVVTFNKKKMKKPAGVQLENEPYDEEKDGTQKSGHFINSAADLTLNHIEHTGFEDTSLNQQTMCFGCWSAGLNKKCSLHEGGRKVKASETMLLCRNWELEVMKRRYRSEEIQEIFMKKESSLRYNPKYHRFYTVIEQKHPIYRMSSQLLERFNARLTLFLKIKYWLRSLAEEYRQGKIHPDTKEMARLLRINRGLYNLKRIERFSTINRHLLPIAPITGYSWPERCNDIQYLFKYFEKVVKEEVDIIKIEPIPVPKKLYEPREYHMAIPQTIPLLPYGQGAEITDPVLPANSFINDLNPAAWVEKMASAIVRDKVDAAMMQIKALTPLANSELKMKTKKPAPYTLKYATLGSKPLPGNLAVGGLPLEFLVYLIVSTYFPPQYGSFTVMDKSTVSPGVSPEITISFETVIMPPTVEEYIERPLEHPLSYRRPPTITANSNIDPQNKHFYGLNRPEQTGEQEHHGFRTTTWAPMLLTNPTLDPQVFVPGQEVVSLNVPKANTSNTTHADYTYPFCEPSTRDNSTLDFYHLLLTGVVSLAKAQIFTALSVQEPGEFQKAYRTDLPMGPLVVSVYRSWGFTQSDTIQEFKTDDGVSYWYHRKTGQTFWERPLYDDEDRSPLEGGTVLDMDHPEEPTMMTRGHEGATRRYTQGDFRKQMLMHIETKKDALNRRKAASVTVKNARQRGVLPEPPAVQSIVNHAPESVDFGSKIDFHQSLATSMGVNESQVLNNQPYGQQGATVAVASASDQLQLQQAFPTRPQTSQTPAGFPQQGGQRTFPNTPQQQQQQQQQFFAPSSVDEGSWAPNNQIANYPNSAGANFQSTGDVNLVPSRVASSQGQFGQNPMTPMAGMMGGGFDANIVNVLSQTLGNMFTNMMHLDKTNPQDMIQLGMGMGMILMQTGAVQNMAQNQLAPPGSGSNGNNAGGGGNGQFNASMSDNGSGQGRNDAHVAFPTVGEELSLSVQDTSQFSYAGADLIAGQQQFASNQQNYGGEPIGKVHPTLNLTTDRHLEHSEEVNQKVDVAKRFDTPLNTMEIARNLKIEQEPLITPDEMPPKVLTHEKPSNAEDAVRELKAMPLVAYPELSTIVPGGAPNSYEHKSPAGLGVSYVAKEDEETQKKVEGNPHLRRTVLPLPVGFFDAIEAKHVAKQAADYLPQVPNLPQSRTIGRVKPRSAAADWLMISFDPWSAGKNPLGTEFVPSLMAKADKFLGGGAQAMEAMESLRQQTISDAYVQVMDQEGLAQQKAEISKAQIMAQDFKKLCSLCRHSKFAEAEQLINQPDWAVPIDYQDEQGNALIHIAAQNGSKRLVKLCLRRGASLNLQNLNGQTALHFAFGYGYTDVGDYLVSKGADDSIRNKDGLTCYEGLEGRELALL